VLEGVSFNVRESEIFFIVGGTGVGKTTLLRNMVGLRCRPMARSGSTGVRSRAPTRPSAARCSRPSACRSRAAPSGPPHPEENIGLPLEEYTRLPKDEIGRIAAFRLSQVASRVRGLLSGRDQRGMKKRPARPRTGPRPGDRLLRRAVGGLDPVTARNLDRLILQIRDTFGTTIVIVSHDVDSILGIADRLIMLDVETRASSRRGPGGAHRGAAEPQGPRILTRRTIRSG